MPLLKRGVTYVIEDVKDISLDARGIKEGDVVMVRPDVVSQTVTKSIK